MHVFKWLTIVLQREGEVFIPRAAGYPGDGGTQTRSELLLVGV